MKIIKSKLKTEKTQITPNSALIVIGTSFNSISNECTIRLYCSYQWVDHGCLQTEDLSLNIVENNIKRPLRMENMMQNII